MKFYVRTCEINQVTVADQYTGYAVATFYFQAGADNKAKFPALKFAELFMRAVEKEEEQRTIYEKVRQEHQANH